MVVVLLPLRAEEGAFPPFRPAAVDYPKGHQTKKSDCSPYNKQVRE